MSRKAMLAGDGVPCSSFIALVSDKSENQRAEADMATMKTNQAFTTMGMKQQMPCTSVPI